MENITATKAEIKKHLEEHFIRHSIGINILVEYHYETDSGNFITRQDDGDVLIWKKDGCGTISKNEFVLEGVDILF